MDKLKFWPEFCAYVWGRFVVNGNRENAAVLTFTTLFALVPIMTVTYAALSLVPSYKEAGESLQALVFQHFMPGTGETVKEYLVKYSEQARKLSGFGLLFLFVTTLMLLMNVEKTFNKIWQVKRARKGKSAFLMYWAIMSLGPVLVVAGFTLSSYLISLPWIDEATTQISSALGWLKVMPFLLATTVFTLLYVLVPNCKVKLLHAVLGGLLIALCFEIAKYGFTKYVSLFPTYSLIYGAFAVVPLFLLWGYLSWLLILFGAEIVHGFGTFKANAIHPDKEIKLFSSMYILDQLSKAYEAGKALSMEDLIKSVPLQQTDQVEKRLGSLAEVGYVTMTDSGDWILAKDLNTISLDKLQRALNTPLPEQAQFEQLAQLDNPKWLSPLQHRIDQVGYAQRDYLNVSIAELLAYQPSLALGVAAGEGE